MFVKLLSFMLFFNSIKIQALHESASKTERKKYDFFGQLREESVKPVKLTFFNKVFIAIIFF